MGQIFTAERQALADGLHTGSLVILGVSATMLLLTPLLPDVPLRERSASATEAKQTAQTVQAA